MSYASTIRDIPKRSIWVDADGTRVVIVVAAEGYVSFVRAKGEKPQTIHEQAFRARFESLYDRAALRSRFSMSLANLVEFRAYWVPSQRRVITRGIASTKPWPIPPDSEFIGRYAHPCSSEDFIEDLDNVIARLHVAAASQARSQVA